jgi:hypothetical protein
MQCIMTSRGNTLGPDLMVQAKVTCSDDWAKYS